ncbi:MAG: hypothetical protein AAF960_15520 [Bacteroidota bacterium]
MERHINFAPYTFMEKHGDSHHLFIAVPLVNTNKKVQPFRKSKTGRIHVFEYKILDADEEEATKDVFFTTEEINDSLMEDIQSSVEVRILFDGENYGYYQRTLLMSDYSTPTQKPSMVSRDGSVKNVPYIYVAGSKSIVPYNRNELTVFVLQASVSGAILKGKQVFERGTLSPILEKMDMDEELKTEINGNQIKIYNYPKTGVIRPKPASSQPSIFVKLD